MNDGKSLFEASMKVLQQWNLTNLANIDTAHKPRYVCFIVVLVYVVVVALNNVKFRQVIAQPLRNQTQKTNDKFVRQHCLHIVNHTYIKVAQGKCSTSDQECGYVSNNVHNALIIEKHADHGKIYRSHIPLPSNN